MKMYCRFLLPCAVAVLLNLIAVPIVRATPYASGITVTNGNVIFYLNEAGANVTVTYENGSTNTSFNGITTGLNEPAGQYSFPLGTHTGYAISVYKQGNGTPFQISNDSSNFANWSGCIPRGVAVNKFPQVGKSFGRIYAGEAFAAGGSGAATKYPGLYAANADFSDALGQGTNPVAGGYYSTPAFISAEAVGDTTANGPSYSFPWKMRVAPDGSLLVVDGWAAVPAGDLLQFTSDLSSSNFIFSQTQPNATSLFGDFAGTPDLLITNTAGVISQALWIFDSGLAAPGGETFGPGTGSGNYNCAFLYGVGTNSISPYTNGPIYAYSVGLGGLSELHPEGDIGVDGKIICGFERANGSNPDVQILDPTGSTVLWTSWVDTGGVTGPDPWAGVSGPVGGAWAGVRESLDGRYLAAVDIDDGITLANLTNGLPDDSTLFYITNAPETGDSRGMDWDAADNIYVISSGQGLLRAFSLGLTTTCVTSNDITGTNGTFALILPPVSASVVATTPQASQNYINSPPPGTPIPGVFTISLSTSSLTATTVVNFKLGGTAVLGVNYTVPTGTDANGVVITTTNVTFPPRTYPGSGNWAVNVQIVPTATPVSGPTLTVNMTIPGGADYFAGSPSHASVAILNTGPQLLFLTPASFGTGMSRNVPNDYAQFAVTRWGDLSHSSYTVTNINYGGTGSYPADFAAGAQRFNINVAYYNPPYPATLQNGAPGIVINPNDVTVSTAIGNPVMHSNLSAVPKDATIVLSLTNSLTGTNLTSSEGASYSVSPASVTLTELDNAVGPEVVLWSDPLTNSPDSTNWTLTFSATNLTGTLGFQGRTLPVLIHNYTNEESARINGGTNDFEVLFGNPVASDQVPQSQVMAQKGWANALKMTVNKDGGDAQAAVNLYPQGRTYAGNYALRFNMYLSLYDIAIGSPQGTPADEFAIFGINHTGTNCNWRLAFTDPVTPGYTAPVNADGDWFAIDAGYGSVSPADFDAFASPKLPNRGIGVSGGVSDIQSSPASSQIGVFKSPPFVSQDDSAGALAPGGEPVNQWVNVDVEVTGDTNVSVYINRTQVIPTFSLNDSAVVNGGYYTNGLPMLGYLDPYPDVSDHSAYVYYSNVRIVELSPYLTGQPVSVIATNGANVSFTASANLATAPLTDVWYTANGSVPVAPVLTNTAAATNLISTLQLNNVQIGNNFVSVFSDASGPITNQVASLEVVGVTNVTAAPGANAQLSVTASGQSAPTSYQWMFNGSNLANSSHYGGVTTATLTITNVQSADAGAYSVAVVNAAGTATPSGTLTVGVPSQPDITSVSIQGDNTIGNFISTDPSDTTSSFTLQSSVVVQGPYTNNPAAVFTGGSGTFKFTVPITTNDTMFYRLVHN